LKELVLLLALLDFVQPYYLSLFIRHLIFLHRLKQAQTALSSDAQRGVVPVLTNSRRFPRTGAILRIYVFSRGLDPAQSIAVVLEVGSRGCAQGLLRCRKI